MIRRLIAWLRMQALRREIRALRECAMVCEALAEGRGALDHETMRLRWRASVLREQAARLEARRLSA